MIDTHVHLNEMHDARAAILRAVSAGVERIVAVGMDLDSNRQTLELADRFPEIVLPAVGYHPWKIREADIDPTVSFIAGHLDRCIALGEIGLDYKVKVPKRLQRSVLERLLALAVQARKPVNVHSRLSYERTHRMVSGAGVERAVFHWYAGPLDILDRILADGYFISATPALAYSRYHQSCIAHAPLEQILIETDSPQEYEGKASEPAQLLTTLHLLGRLKNVSESEAARITTANARRFYGIG